MTLSGALIIFGLAALLALVVGLVRLAMFLDALGCSWLFTGRQDDE